MRRRTLLLFLLVTGLVLGLSAPALAGSDEDQTIAEDSVLTEDDVLDYGLEEDTGGEETPLPRAPECRKIRAVDRATDRRPNAESSFGDDLGTVAESKVVVYPSERAAEKAIGVYTTSTASDCIELFLENTLQENLEPGSDYEFSGEPTEVPLGDESIVYQITITITDPEGDITDLYVELGVIRVGRGLAFLSFTGIDAPFEGSEDLATIVVDNIELNLGDADVGV